MGFDNEYSWYNDLQVENGDTDLSGYHICRVGKNGFHSHNGGLCRFPFQVESLSHKRWMLIRQISIFFSSMLAMWVQPISPLLHACCDNDLTGHVRHSPPQILSVTSRSLCFCATCGANSPLVMILAMRLHFLLLVALWIIFFLSSSPTDMYWKP